MSRSRLWLIVALAAAVRIPVAARVMGQRGFTWVWGGEVASISYAITKGQGFSSPYSAPDKPFTGPTAQQTPVYPYILAGLSEAVGSMDRGVKLALLFGLVCSTLTTIAVIGLGQRLGVGTLAGMAWALSPALGYSDVSYLWGTALITSATLFLLWWAVSGPRWPLWGFAFGVSLLIDPSIAVAFAALLSLWVVLGRVEWRQVAAAAVCSAIVLAPWLVRNRAELGVWQIKTNLGYELVRGLSTDPFDPNGGRVVAAMNPGRNPNEFRVYQQLGETKYMALQSERASQIRQASATGRVIARRIVAFWVGGAEVGPGLFAHVVFALPALLALIGVWLAYRSDVGQIGLVFLLVYPLPYYATVTQPRYRAPLEPILVLMASYVGRRLWETVRQRSGMPSEVGEFSTLVPRS